MEELIHISLFTGIGGIDLAAEWAGFKTIAFVENDPYCQKVLKKHWPDVPIIGDIKDVTRERIQEVVADSQIRKQSQFSEGDNSPDSQKRPEFGTGTGSIRGSIASRTDVDRRTTEAIQNESALPPVTLITGGFPCQPVSQAGKRKGKDDDRWLWPEMLRVISEVMPDWVVAENVAGLLNMGFNDCVSDLESQGYETQSFLIPACAVNAPHRRDRIFIVANSRYDVRPNLEVAGNNGQAITDNQERAQRGQQPTGPSGSQGRDIDVANTQGIGIQGSRALGEQEPETRAGEVLLRCNGPRGGASYWAVEPELGRVAHGIPHRVDRLRCLGNAVVPQQIYPILKAIADIERGRLC